MASSTKKSIKDLGYLGIDFQRRLVHEFTIDRKFFEDLNCVIDQNMFTESTLKKYVGTMKDYYDKYGSVPSFETMRTLLYENSTNDVERDTVDALVDEFIVMDTEDEAHIRETASRFFRQQNIIRTANQILKIAGNGDASQYDSCVALLNDAMTKGTHEDLGTSVFENQADVLSDDYRVPIPTGVGKIDETLEGGIGKGELGVIVGPSSFGKVQPYDAKIVTPDGKYTLMRDIKVGSEILGRDGHTTKVTEVFPHNDWDFYRVTFEDGTSTECGLEHLWNVISDADDAFKKEEHLADDFRTVSLNYIFNNYHEHDFYIPICYMVRFKDYKIMDRFGKLRKYEKQGKIDNYFDRKLACDVDTVDTSKLTEEEWEDIKFIVHSFGYRFTKLSDTVYECKFCSNSADMLKITNIEYSRKADGQCILVDNKEHLYLTDDFIVTHNTSLTTSIANYAATYKCEQNNNQGYKVLQVVFEDRIKQIQRKHIGKITGIESKDLSKPEFIDIVKERLEKYEDKEMLSKNLRIVRFPSGEKTAWDLERFIKKLCNSGFRPDLCIFDYFECLKHKADPSATNEFEKEGTTMRKFESMAGELNMAFWIPLQGTKDSVNADLVTMDKAGGSFKKIQIAHIVMSIARSVEDIANNKATIAILKNRAGQAGKVFNNVDFNNGTCIISTDNVDELDSMFDYNSKKEKDIDELSKSIAKKIQLKQ